MADFNAVTTGSIDILSPLGGGALLFPRGFWIPGTVSCHTGYYGIGSQIAFGQASLAAGQGPYPFAFRADGNSAANGVWTTTGVHNIVGSTNLTGKNFFSAVATTKILGGTITVSSGTTKVVSASTLSLVGGIKTVIASPSIVLGGAVTVAGLGNLQSLGAIWSAKKGFDIKHPTKDDHRLRYICLEGPDAEVYLRGKLKDGNIIELPDYWRNLVDVETIGVTLTPIGHYQELFVDKIEWGTKIIIKNNLAGPINCSFVVFAERKDGEKNIPEYKGLTPADYPGDNREYVINGKSFV